MFTEGPSQYARLGGELNSYESQLKQLEADLEDFKDVHKKYRDQLVKVKVCCYSRQRKTN